MILGIGNDLVDIARIEKAIERHGDKFIERCFTPHERAKAQSRTDEKARLGTYAKRFAAKEACAKALGTGIAKGMHFRDFEMQNSDNGAPIMVLRNKAQDYLRRITPNGMEAHIHLSCTDDDRYAQAFVVIEARML